MMYFFLFLSNFCDVFFGEIVMINYRDDIFFRHVIVYTSFFLFLIISSLILNVWASSGRSFSRGPPGGAAVVDAHYISHRVFTRFFWLVLTGGVCDYQQHRK